jgi:hypothetical protein
MAPDEASGDRPIAYQDTDGTIVYRASSVGACPRRLWAARMGYESKPTPEKFQAIFDRGHEIEAETLVLLAQKGYKVDSNQAEVSVAITKTLKVVGHIDGIVTSPRDYVVRGTDPDTRFLLEIKGLGPDYYDQLLTRGIKSFPHYAYQLTTYLRALQPQGITSHLFVVNRKELPDDHPQKLWIATVGPLPQWSEVANRVTSIEDAVRDNKMPDCSPSYPCPFYYLHDEPDLSPPDPHIDARLQDYFALSSKIDSFTQVKNILRDKIRELVPEGEYKSALGTVSWTKGSRTLDQTKIKSLFQQAGLDIEDYKKDNEPTLVIKQGGKSATS